MKLDQTDDTQTVLLMEARYRLDFQSAGDGVEELEVLRHHC